MIRLTWRLRITRNISMVNNMHIRLSAFFLQPLINERALILLNLQVIVISSTFYLDSQDNSKSKGMYLSIILSVASISKCPHKKLKSKVLVYSHFVLVGCAQLCQLQILH